jgi:hypothetical protein
MSSERLIQQANGKYAVFSVMAGRIILSDATREELANYYANRAAIRERLRIADWVEGRLAAVGQPVYTQEEALEWTTEDQGSSRASCPPPPPRPTRCPCGGIELEGSFVHAERCARPYARIPRALAQADATAQARAWLGARGRAVYDLHYTYKRKSGEHVFRGKEPGRADQIPPRKGVHPSNTVRFRAVVDTDGRISDMVEISTSQRKRLSQRPATESTP